MTVTYRIHPAIGIARLGDSPDDYFVGPEAPGVMPPLIRADGTGSAPGKYKDAAHRVKRQGARFRVYEYVYSGPKCCSPCARLRAPMLALNGACT